MRTLSFIAKRNLFILAMIVAVVASWLLLDREREGASQADDAPATPDSYFVDMNLVRHDDNGRPSMNIRAGSARHFPDNPIVYLESVEARGRQDGANWSLNAVRGELASDANRLHVEEDVVLVQSEPGRPALTMQTPVLDIDADTEVVETTAAVEIRYGESRITGTGLWASLADGHMIIESEVSARYEP